MKHNHILALFVLINGREFTFNEFENYLCQHGIQHQTTIPYNPQQNGVAETMNMNLSNMVRSMMFFKNVKLMCWDDAILCAVYVKNKIPSHALGNKTPYEMWYGRIPSVRHLRVFGSTCYALIPKEQRNKLDARSRDSEVHLLVVLKYHQGTSSLQ
jgi:transposase InsO family protein